MYNLEPIVSLTRQAGPRSDAWLELLYRGRESRSQQKATPAQWRDWYSDMPRRVQQARAGYPGARISINISTRQLLDNRIHAFLVDLAQKDRCLSIEWTEELLSAEDRRYLVQAAERLWALREPGRVIVGLDDAGAGEDALRRLTCLPSAPDFIKMDGALLKSARERPFIFGVLQAHLLAYRQAGMIVVIERIETADDVELARDVGADYGQGYYFCGIKTADVANG